MKDSIEFVAQSDIKATNTMFLPNVFNGILANEDEFYETTKTENGLEQRLNVRYKCFGFTKSQSKKNPQHNKK